MPVNVTAEELAFLREANRLAGGDRNAQEIARELGVANSTLGYRLMRSGFKTLTKVQIVDIRTGRTFAEMDAAGEFVVTDEAGAPVLSGAA